MDFIISIVAILLLGVLVFSTSKIFRAIVLDIFNIKYINKISQIRLVLNSGKKKIIINHIEK